MKNKRLKIAMKEAEVTYTETAAKMGRNAKVFANKINQRTVNGNVVRFNVTEKEWLANEFGLKASEIE